MRARRLLPATLLILGALYACEDAAVTLAPEPTGPDPVVLPDAPRMSPLAIGMEGYPTVGELRTGYIAGRDGQPLKIVYEIQEGLAIWQGDMVLGDAHEIASTPGGLASSVQGPLRGVVIDPDGGNTRWPGGVIPFTIDATDPPTQSIVDEAIEWIEDQTPGVTLVPRTSETDYVTFRDASGCSSEIGRVGGQQFINLKVSDGVTFCSVGNAAHEILHALGMFHEHTRCDRDSFVDIDFDEVEDGREGNFYKAGSGTENGACSDAFDVDAYDFGSIMHYSVDAFAIDANPTIIPIVDVPAGVTVGQRDALGDTDVETIAQLYGSNNASPVVDLVGPTGDLLEGSTVSFDASSSTDPDDDDDILTFSWIFGDGTCPGPAACSAAAPDHVYANDGEYGYSVSVSDGFDVAAAGSSVNILNVVPDVSAGSDATLDEGDELSRNGTFTDPGADPWSATVDYGDGGGAVALPLAGKSFSLQHTYADDAGSPFTLTVAVTDDHDTGTDDVQVTVNNVSPTVAAGADAEVASGETYAFSGTFSDPGLVDDPWDWTIAWGDGTEDTGSTDDQSAAITSSLQVCAAGTYVVTLSVTDKDGGTGSDDLQLTVPHVEIEIDIMPGSDTNPISLRKGGNVAVAILASDDLDVADIDPSSLVLGDEVGPDTAIGQKDNGRYEAYVEDVNGDGRPDLVVMFSTRDLVAAGDLTELSTELVLRGLQTDGCTNLRGVDVVSVPST